MDSIVSAEPANEMKRRELHSMIPRRKRKKVGDTKKDQYPVAHDHDQGTMNSHDNYMSWATRTSQQYYPACAMKLYQSQLDHMFSASSTPMMGGNRILDISTDQMHHPNLMMEGSYGGNEPVFPMLTNASRRATISNQDSFTSRATRMFEQYPACGMKMYQSQLGNTFSASSAQMMGDNCILDVSIDQMHHLNPSGYTDLGIKGEQVPMTEGRYGDNEPEFPTINNASQRAMISNMMIENHLSKQPTDNHEETHRRWSAPVCEEASTQVQFRATYEAHELDISDSDVVGMWHSSKLY